MRHTGRLLGREAGKQLTNSPLAVLGCKPIYPSPNRLLGLMVKASASRVEDPEFESRLRQDFFAVESYQ